MANGCRLRDRALRRRAAEFRCAKVRRVHRGDLAELGQANDHGLGKLIWLAPLLVQASYPARIVATTRPYPLTCTSASRRTRTRPAPAGVMARQARVL